MQVDALTKAQQVVLSLLHTDKHAQGLPWSNADSAGPTPQFHAFGAHLILGNRSCEHVDRYSGSLARSHSLASRIVSMGTWRWKYHDQFEDTDHFERRRKSPILTSSKAIPDGLALSVASRVRQWDWATVTDHSLACPRMGLWSLEPLGSPFDGQQSQVGTHWNSPQPGGVQVPTRTVKSNGSVFSEHSLRPGLQEPSGARVTPACHPLCLSRFAIATPWMRKRRGSWSSSATSGNVKTWVVAMSGPSRSPWQERSVNRWAWIARRAEGIALASFHSFVQQLF